MYSKKSLLFTFFQVQIDHPICPLVGTVIRYIEPLLFLKIKKQTDYPLYLIRIPAQLFFGNRYRVMLFVLSYFFKDLGKSNDLKKGRRLPFINFQCDAGHISFPFFFS